MSQQKPKNELPKGVYRRMVRGQECFLVSLGRDANGKQRWKSCKTLDEALTQRTLLESAKQQQGESLWMLSAEQRADAVGALDKLKPFPGESLQKAADYYLHHYLALKRDDKIEGLVDKYLGEQTGVSLGTMRDLRCRLRRIKAQFGDRLPNDVSVEDIKGWIARMGQEGLGPTSIRHNINKASSFFRWCVANRYATANPLDRAAIRRPKIVRGEVAFYSPEQVAKILEVLGRYGLLNYGVLGTFTGIRPDEIRRLKDTHFKIDGSRIVVTLGADVTKVRWRRVIELERGTPLGDCLWAWLGGNGKLELPEQIAPSLITFKRRFRLLREELGFAWIKDGLRHTAATYLYALTRDERVVSAVLGNSPDILAHHYKGLTTEAEARKFYALRPAAH